MIVIETPRLRLREWTLADLDAQTEIYGDPETMRTFATGETFTREELAASLPSLLDDYERYGYGNYAVVERDTGQILGHAGARYSPERKRTGLDIALRRQVHARGYGTEVLRAVIRSAFVEHGVDELYAVARADNAPAVALMRRLGMTFRKSLDAHGAPSVLYVLHAE